MGYKQKAEPFDVPKDSKSFEHDSRSEENHFNKLC